MFVFLSKKIAIPNGAKIHSLAWNASQGWIACGGENGLLKVLKLEVNADSKARGVAAPTNLSMNQTLDGHQGGVVCCVWNKAYRKLTTSDQYGLIIVWMLHRQMWYEEMINNRNKSVVKDMCWTADGGRICIGYADGGVIAGGVDGNRLWAKETGLDLKFVQWSPDGRTILFATEQSKIYIFDQKGNNIGTMPLSVDPHASGSVIGDDENGDNNDYNLDRGIIAVDWYDGTRGHVDIDAPDLAIAFANGYVQITKGLPPLKTKSVRSKPRKTRESKHSEEDPRQEEQTDIGVPNKEGAHTVLIDTGMSLSKASWSSDGSVLAIAGSQSQKLPSGDVRRMCMVQFYSPFGQHLRTLKVPGGRISALTWEGTSLRIALAVDSFIYFANIRQDYRWGYFANTLCYAFTRPDRKDHTVVFWDTHAEEKHVKYVKRLMHVRAAGEHAILTSRGAESVQASKEGAPLIYQYGLILCNSIGSAVDSKVISIEPTFLAMTSQFIVVADEKAIYAWQYRTSGGARMASNTSSVAPVSNSSNPANSALQATLLDVTNAQSSNRSNKAGRERVVHIDIDPSRLCVTGLSVLSNNDKPTGKKAAETRKSLLDLLSRATTDPIACIAVNDRCLVVGRSSGSIHRYTLPHLTLESKVVVRCRPQQLALNSDNTKMSVIDINGVLSIVAFDKAANDGARQLDFERKDTWDMMWASDNPDLMAVMEKTRLYIFRGLEPEEPVLSSGYVCKHENLQIKAVMLDEIMAQPHAPVNDLVVNFPTKSLRDAREMLRTERIEDVAAYIDGHPHPKLWRILAEASLERLEFSIAEKAFVKCADYPGIQLVKTLRLLNDKTKQRAQVASYFERFDEAEALYRDIDRKDLAIDLRMMLGDWFRVKQLIQMSNGVSVGAGDDELMRRVQREIGSYYAARQKWNKAVQYFANAKDPESLIECYYLLEEYNSLEKLVRVIPENSPVLIDIARKFQSVGMSQAACTAYLKAGDVKAAIDCCVLLNQWDQAVELAQEYEFPQIEGLLAKYASHLLEKGEKLQAIELYRRAHKSTQAASLLASLAQEAGRTKVNPLDAKKLHVLAAMEMEELRTRVLDTQLKTMGLTQQPMDNEDPDAEFELGTKRKGARTRATMQMTAAQTTAATLESLVQHDAATGQNRSLDNAWKGAEGYHLFMLAQRQLYNGRVKDALITSLQLRSYDDVLDPRDVHSLIALTAYHNEAWGQCSKAFVELESLKSSSCSAEDRDAFASLALKIFTANRPVDPADIAEKVEEIAQGHARKDPICMMSGNIIDEDSSAGQVYKCRRCSRKMLDRYLRGVNNCPLCHIQLM